MRLPARQRQVIALRLILDLDTSRTAEVLGITPNTVMAHMARALAALAYMTIAGSLIGFTCYEWLLHRMPASTVTSYAYVNPVVALAIGHWLGNEALTTHTIVGSVIILASVAAILRPKPQPA